MKKGFVSIFLLIFMSAVFLLTFCMLRMCFAQASTINDHYLKIKSSYLAETGIELAKNRLMNCPGWYTDLAFTGKDKSNWLVNVSKGENFENIKIIREKDKNELYSIGWSGKALSIVRLEFTLFPFKAKKWEEL